MSTYYNFHLSELSKALVGRQKLKNSRLELCKNSSIGAHGWSSIFNLGTYHHSLSKPAFTFELDPFTFEEDLKRIIESDKIPYFTPTGPIGLSPHSQPFEMARSLQALAQKLISIPCLIGNETKDGLIGLSLLADHLSLRSNRPRNGELFLHAIEKDAPNILCTSATRVRKSLKAAAATIENLYGEERVKFIGERRSKKPRLKFRDPNAFDELCADLRASIPDNHERTGRYQFHFSDSDIDEPCEIQCFREGCLIGSVIFGSHRPNAFHLLIAKRYLMDWEEQNSEPKQEAA